MSKFTRWFGRSSQNISPRLMQYVGDEAVLIFGKDEVFVYVDGRDASLTPCLLRDGTWEPALGAYLKRTLRSGDCFVDIGANNGIHALRAARHVGPKGRVIAFEPQQRLFDLLQRSACANLLLDRMHICRMAVGASEGVAELGKFAHLAGSATLTPNSQIIERETVPIAPLPVALAAMKNEINAEIRPRIIKIDVEGFEYDVWLGMREWTKDYKDLTLVIEYSPVSYRDTGYDPRLLLNEFEQYGFNISVLESNGSTRVLMDDEMDLMARSDRQYDLVIGKHG